MDRYHTNSGIVINKKKVNDSDILLTLLTPHQGKILALAKGASRINSRRLSSLQLGNTIKVHLYQQQNRYWVSETKILVSFMLKPKNLAQISLLFYFFEIINKFVGENQQIEGAYLITQNIIKSIDQNHFVAFIKNEIALLDLLGFGHPKQIDQTLDQKNYRLCQKHLQQYFESILENPLESSKLFH